MIINDENHWRISKSGYSIKTGWSDDKRIIASYHGDPSDHERFKRWLDDAEHICDLHNAFIDKGNPYTAAAERREGE